MYTYWPYFIRFAQTFKLKINPFINRVYTKLPHTLSPVFFCCYLLILLPNNHEVYFSPTIPFFLSSTFLFIHRSYLTKISLLKSSSSDKVSPPCPPWSLVQDETATSFHQHHLYCDPGTKRVNRFSERVIFRSIVNTNTSRTFGRQFSSSKYCWKHHSEMNSNS